jgi:hypothetical protein
MYHPGTVAHFKTIVTREKKQEIISNEKRNRKD